MQNSQNNSEGEVIQIIDDSISKKKQQLKEKQKEQNIFNKPVVQLGQALSMINDASLLQQQLAYLSKSCIVLSRKVYEQQEKLSQSIQQAHYYREKYQQQREENEVLNTEIAKLRDKPSFIEKQLLMRQTIIDQSTVQQSKEIVFKQQLDDLTLKNKQLQEEKDKLVEKINEYQINIINKNIQVETFINQISQLRQKVNILAQKQKVVSQQQLQMKNMKEQILKAIEDSEQLKQQLSILKTEKIQLKNQLSSVKNPNKPSQIQLKNITKKSQSESESQFSQNNKEFKVLSSKYKNLKKQSQQLKIQNDYLKERMQDMTSNQQQIEHNAIDRFIKVLQIFKDKLKQGQSQNIEQNLNNKKESLIRRYNKQYQKMILSLRKQ